MHAVLLICCLYVMFGGGEGVYTYVYMHISGRARRHAFSASLIASSGTATNVISMFTSADAEVAFARAASVDRGAQQAIINLLRS